VVGLDITREVKIDDDYFSKLTDKKNRLYKTINEHHSCPK